MIGPILISIAVLLRIISNPIGNVFQKQLTSKGYHPMMVNFMTYFILSVGCIFIALQFHWSELPKSFWMNSFLAGFVGALGNGFLIKALQKGDLSILGPINSYKSVIGIIGGILFLGEFPNLWGTFGVIIIIYGSYFILDTTKERFSFALLKRSEIQFRIWAMILTAVEAVFIKKIILVSNTTLAFISWCWFGTLFSFFFLFAYRIKLYDELKKFRRIDYTKFGLLTVSVGTMQFSTNYVFKYIPLGYALSLFQLSTIVSVLLGQKVFKEKDIRKKLIGSLIMIVGSILIILLKG